MLSFVCKKVKIIIIHIAGTIIASSRGEGKGSEDKNLGYLNLSVTFCLLIKHLRQI